jgi:hypothetical protein
VIDYLWVLYVLDGVKRQSRRIIRQRMSDWKGVREKTGEVNSTKDYVTSEETSR